MAHPDVTVFHDEQLVITLHPLMHWGGEGEPAGVTAAKLILDESRWLHRLLVEPSEIVAVFWVGADRDLATEELRLRKLVAPYASGGVIVDRRLA